MVAVGVAFAKSTNLRTISQLNVVSLFNLNLNCHFSTPPQQHHNAEKD